MKRGGDRNHERMKTGGDRNQQTSRQLLLSSAATLASVVRKTGEAPASRGEQKVTGGEVERR